MDHVHRWTSSPPPWEAIALAVEHLLALMRAKSLSVLPPCSAYVTPQFGLALGRFGSVSTCAYRDRMAAISNSNSQRRLLMLNRLWLFACCASLIITGTSAALGQSVPRNVPGGIESTTVAYTPGRGGIQFVKVTVNRTQTATFVFDSGTTNSAICDTLVKRLELKPFPVLRPPGKPITPIEDGKPAQLVLLSSVAMGSFNIVKSPFFVVSAARLSAAFGQPIDGVLGENVAARFPILLDFQKHQLTFFRHSPSPDDLKKIGMGDAVSMSLKKDVNRTLHYSLPVKVTNGSESAGGDMVLETGASSSYISGDMAKRIHLTPQSHGPTSGYNGPISTSDATVSSFQFGEITLADLSVSYVDKPKIASAANNNILGLDVLSSFRVLLDYPASKIYFRLLPQEDAPKVPPIDSVL